MKAYLPRIADKLLEERLDAKGAILIEGPKWCGKTTTAKQKANSFISMDRPDMTRQYQQMAELSPNTLLEGETPRLIDEWQITPNLWNAVRYEVDNRDEFGQFILTGSAVPSEFDDSMHTGTGRISRLLMRPMSLFESKDSSGEVSIKDLFEGKNISAVDETSLEKMAFLICRGGWPKAIGLDEKPALFQAIDYFVEDYKGIYKFLYKMRKAISFFGYPELPEKNTEMKFLYVDIIAKDDDYSNTLEAIKHLQSMGCSCDFFMIGTYENSSLDIQLKKIKSFKYKSKLYKVYYGEDKNKGKDIRFKFWNL